MRDVGAGKWWIAAAYLLSMAVVVAALYAGPFQSQPSPIAASVPHPTQVPEPRATPSADAHATPVPEPSHSATAAPTLIPSLSGDPVLYLAAIGGFPEDVLADLATFVNTKYDIEVRLLAPLSPDESAFDPERDQYVTEELLNGLVQSYPKARPDDGSVVIGILRDDVYILDRPDWYWAFGMRGDSGYAVVSTARMGDLQDPVAPIVMSRLRKMILRNIGVLYYGLPLNQDPISVLYVEVLGVDDLDRMNEELCGSECPAQASVGRPA